MAFSDIFDLAETAFSQKRLIEYKAKAKCNTFTVVMMTIQHVQIYN